ncbi:hypothetical protein [Chthonobacter rhizosphaerae]|uniref:hypothetical protein n=1 Tax=Chthonobacter rhizosphaerae TaxID=2735553 RepID=UPI0015EEF1F9|nr:hypothetical protein [Chthonobacter rhizosphaerae]
MREMIGGGPWTGRRDGRRPWLVLAAATLFLVAAGAVEATSVALARHRVLQAVEAATLAAARSPREPRPAAHAVLARAGLDPLDASFTVGDPDGASDGPAAEPTARRMVAAYRFRVPSALLGWSPVGLGWTVGASATAETVGRVAVTVRPDLAAAPHPVREAVVASLFGLSGPGADAVITGLAGAPVGADDILAVWRDVSGGDPAPDMALPLDTLFAGLAVRAGLPPVQRGWSALVGAPAVTERTIRLDALLDPLMLRGEARAPGALALDGLDVAVGAGLRALGSGPLTARLDDPHGAAGTIVLTLQPLSDLAGHPLVDWLDLGETAVTPRFDLAVSATVGGSRSAAVPTVDLSVGLRFGGGTLRPVDLGCPSASSGTAATLAVAPGPIDLRFGLPPEADPPSADLTSDGGLILKAFGRETIPAPEARSMAIPAEAIGPGHRVEARGVAETRPALGQFLSAADVRVGLKADASEAVRSIGEARLRAAAAELLRDAAGPVADAVEAFTGALGIAPDRLAVSVLGVDCDGARLAALPD